MDAVKRLADSPLFQSRWDRYARNRLAYPLSAVEVLNAICDLIGPILEAIVEEKEAFGVWIPSLQRYVSAATGDGDPPAGRC